jgi:hypothetical protein
VDGERETGHSIVSRWCAENGWRSTPTHPVWGYASGCEAISWSWEWVLEIAIRYNTDAFRTVVAVQLGSKIYVLYAFQKKSKTGKKTPLEDVNLIKKRYREAEELAKHAT